MRCEGRKDQREGEGEGIMCEDDIGGGEEGDEAMESVDADV